MRPADMEGGKERGDVDDAERAMILAGPAPAVPDKALTPCCVCPPRISNLGETPLALKA